MSKENVISFLEKAKSDPELKSQVKEASQKEDLVDLGETHGYSFSPENLRDALPVIQEKKGFFGDLVEAVLELFGPSHDDYPTTGVQPFSGDPNRS
jgi:predicted ribosomally synthesized peptide with nif11-like leader